MFHTYNDASCKILCLYIWTVKAEAYFEEGKVDLFRISILLFVNTCVEILHIQDNT